MQRTKDDYTHTFLVHNIDGPALVGLGRETMMEWKVKPQDIHTILKGIGDLRRISDGSIGWQPGADDAVHLPTEPTAPKAQSKPAPRKKPKPPPAAEAATAGAPAVDGGDAAEATTFSLTQVPLEPASTKPKRSAHEASMASLESAGKGASPSYMRKVMSELHSSERVPLWKEEMVERVKRAATARQAKADQAELKREAVAPKTARSLGHSSRRGGLSADDDAASNVSGTPRRAGGHGGTGRAESVADSLAESGTLLVSAAAKEIERKLFWYQDAIHEQELQQQLLDQKIRALSEEEAQVLEKRRTDPALKGIGAANLEKELNKRMMREKNRLSRALQVTEERVADAERFNQITVEQINKLRRGRADYMRQSAKLEERVASMAGDMKHFSQGAHASLDEKEKMESRLKRLRYDYNNELSHTEHVFGQLQEELQALEERIAMGHADEEQFLQTERQNTFRHVRQLREDEQKRELRLGYLQNHVRGQEMDFQRLHRIMGVKFTPEKPDSVQEIVKASLNHEQRNSSLLHYVSVQNQQMEEADLALQQLEEEEKRVLAMAAKAKAAEKVKASAAEQNVGSAAAIERGILKREVDLSKLCPLVLALSSMIGGGADTLSDGGMLALKGCRPDTLADFLRLIDERIKELHQRAETLPTAAGNEWLRDFLRPKEVVSDHPSVTELRRELEVAAQKQREAKEAKALVSGTANADDSQLPPVEGQ